MWWSTTTETSCKSYISNASEMGNGTTNKLVSPNMSRFGTGKRSKHIKCSEERYLLGQNTTCEFLGYSHLSSYKTTLNEEVNGEKRLKIR